MLFSKLSEKSLEIIFTTRLKKVNLILNITISSRAILTEKKPKLLGATWIDMEQLLTFDHHAAQITTKMKAHICQYGTAYSVYTHGQRPQTPANGTKITSTGSENKWLHLVVGVVANA